MIFLFEYRCFLFLFVLNILCEIRFKNIKQESYRIHKNKGFDTFIN